MSLGKWICLLSAFLASAVYSPRHLVEPSARIQESARWIEIKREPGYVTYYLAGVTPDQFLSVSDVSEPGDTAIRSAMYFDSESSVFGRFIAIEGVSADGTLHLRITDYSSANTPSAYQQKMPSAGPGTNERFAAAMALMLLDESGRETVLEVLLPPLEGSGPTTFEWRYRPQILWHTEAYLAISFSTSDGFFRVELSGESLRE